MTVVSPITLRKYTMEGKGPLPWYHACVRQDWTAIEKRRTHLSEQKEGID
jgi:hypothetical protein